MTVRYCVFIVHVLVELTVGHNDRLLQSNNHNYCDSNGTGLEIHLGNMSQSYRFDYSWGAFNQSVCPFQKMPLTLYEATFVHIRVHKLTQDDSLKLFMSMMASIPATMAIVLINFDNSYRLSEKFLSEEQSSPVPVILVTNETGLELLKLLHENPRDVEATIHSQPPMIEPPHCKSFEVYVYTCVCSIKPHACCFVSREIFEV